MQQTHDNEIIVNHYSFYIHIIILTHEYPLVSPAFKLTNIVITTSVTFMAPPVS